MPEKLYIYAVRGLGLLQHVGVDSASNKPKVILKVKSHTNADVVKPKFSPSRTKKVPEIRPRHLVGRGRRGPGELSQRLSLLR